MAIPTGHVYVRAQPPQPFHSNPSRHASQPIKMTLLHEFILQTTKTAVKKFSKDKHLKFF